MVRVILKEDTLLSLLLSHTSFWVHFLVVYNRVKDGFLRQVYKRGGTDLHVAKLSKKNHFLQNQQFLSQNW